MRPPHCTELASFHGEIPHCTEKYPTVRRNTLLYGEATVLQRNPICSHSIMVKGNIFIIFISILLPRGELGGYMGISCKLPIVTAGSDCRRRFKFERERGKEITRKVSLKFTC